MFKSLTRHTVRWTAASLALILVLLITSCVPAEAPAKPETEIKREPTVHVVQPTFVSLEVIFGEAAFADQRMREAILMAIPWPDLAQAVYPDMDVAISAGQLRGGWRIDNLFDMPYDPDATWALFAETGYPNGVQPVLVFNPEQDRLPDVAQVMNKMLAEAGIDSEPVAAPGNEAFQVMTEFSISGSPAIWLRLAEERVVQPAGMKRIGGPLPPDKVEWFVKRVASSGLIPAEAIDVKSAAALTFPGGGCCELVGADTNEPVYVEAVNGEAVGILYVDPDSQASPYPPGVFALARPEAQEYYVLVGEDGEIYEPEEGKFLDRAALGLDGDEAAFVFTESSPRRCNWCLPRWAPLIGGRCYCINC